MLSVDDHRLHCFGEMIMAFIDIRLVAPGSDGPCPLIAFFAFQVKFAVGLFVAAERADIVRYADDGRIVIAQEGYFQTRELMKILEKFI